MIPIGRSIDFLSLDVEGVEIEVLKALITRPSDFVTCWANAATSPSLSKYLNAVRYRLVEKFNEHHYLFGR